MGTRSRRIGGRTRWCGDREAAHVLYSTSHVYKQVVDFTHEVLHALFSVVDLPRDKVVDVFREGCLKSLWSDVAFERIRVLAFDAEPGRSRL